MDSDAFDKFDEWVGSQGDLKSSRESEFKFVLEELKAFIEERTGGEEGEVTVVMDEEMTRGMAEVVSRKVHVLLSMRGVEGVDLMKACIEEAGEVSEERSDDIVEQKNFDRQRLTRYTLRYS